MTRALASLVEAFRATGYEVADADGRIPFRSLGLEFRIVDVTFQPRKDYSIVRVGVEAAAQGDARDGIRVNAVGFGATEVEALRRAADQWLDGVFPVLHHWLAQHENELGVLSREMLVADSNSGRRFGWRVHLGPVLYTYYGQAGEPVDTLLTQDDILLALFDEIPAVSAHESMFWIEAFVGRVPGHEVQASCFLHGAAWPDAEVAFREWFTGRPSLDGTGVRQFMLFEPVRPDALTSASLAKTLDAEVAKAPGTPKA